MKNAVKAGAFADSPSGQDGFRRRLKSQTLELILTHPTSREILRLTAEDDELQAQLRGSTLDIYYQGYVMFRVGDQGRLQVGSVHDDWPSVPHHLEDLAPAEVARWIDIVKVARKRQLRVGSENSFESKFLRDNDDPTTATIPLDRQVVHPGEGLRRIDVVLYDVMDRCLVLGELKIHDNPEIRTKVFDQLETYRALFERRSSMRAEYEAIFAQKKQMGLIRHAVDSIETASAPALLLLLGGHPDSDYGVTMSPRAIENSLRVKQERWPDLPVRVQYWGNFAQSDLALRHGTSQLPMFEHWAERMLS